MSQAVLVEAPFVTPVVKNDEWATRGPIYDEWNRKLRFTVDAAASDLNHKHARYWTKEQDGLSLSWAGERLFNNPPWSKVAPWVSKALEKEHEVWCGLLPARTDQKWYRALEFDPDTYIKHLGRVRFEDPLGAGRLSPREGAMIAVTFGSGREVGKGCAGCREGYDHPPNTECGTERNKGEKS